MQKKSFHYWDPGWVIEHLMKLASSDYCWSFYWLVMTFAALPWNQPAVSFFFLRSRCFSAGLARMRLAWGWFCLKWWAARFGDHKKNLGFLSKSKMKIPTFWTSSWANSARQQRVSMEHFDRSALLQFHQQAVWWKTQEIWSLSWRFKVQPWTFEDIKINRTHLT